jgi:hypothetical protein
LFIVCFDHKASKSKSPMTGFAEVFPSHLTKGSDRAQHPNLRSWKMQLVTVESLFELLLQDLA